MGKAEGVVSTYLVDRVNDLVGRIRQVQYVGGRGERRTGRSGGYRIHPTLGGSNLFPVHFQAPRLM